MSLFREGSGNLSMMRLMSALCIMAGIAYAFVNKDIAISGMLLGYGFGGKLIQKQMEK